MPVARHASVSAAPAPVAPARHAPGRAIPGASSSAAGLWLRRGVVALWLLAGTAVLLVVLSRLFAAAVPVPGYGGASPAGAGGAPYYYRGDNPGRGYFSGGRGAQGDPTGIVQVP